MYTLEYIPVDGNFEDGTTAILREIGQDSDSPDSDSGSEMELESQNVRDPTQKAGRRLGTRVRQAVCTRLQRQHQQRQQTADGADTAVSTATPTDLIQLDGPIPSTEAC